MDPLSAVFSSMDVQQALVDRLEVTAPWGFRSTPGPNIRLILIMSGSAVIQLKFEKQPIRLESGHLLILFEDVEFSLSDDTSSATADPSAFANCKAGNVWRFGGGGILTVLVAGRFVIDQREVRPILKVLPPFLHLQLDQERNHALYAVLQLISLEIKQPGLASGEMVDRLCEMLVIHAIRAYAADDSRDHIGWLAGISDKRLGKMIQLLHSRLDKKWTVESMAASAGMSRSSFASRFRLIVGQSPLEYLTHWRIHQASLLLRKSDESVAKIAKKVGYASESAFTKIFKKILLTTPMDFRADSKHRLPS